MFRFRICFAGGDMDERNGAANSERARKRFYREAPETSLG